MNRCVVLGTSHSVQRGENRKSDFHYFLISLCQKEAIESIAEEINDNAKFIVAKNVCNQLNINHLIIEPNPSDYQKLGIKEYHTIEYEIMCIYELDEAPSVNSNSSVEALPEFKSRLVSQHCIPREREWLKRILKNGLWPTLVICGANHFESFCSLLSANGIKVTKSTSNWGG